MIALLSILNYFLLAVVDTLDKFLISKRKIFPFTYTFWTVVTGLLVLVVWPFFFQAVPLQKICFNLLAGVFFSGFLYLFFKTLAEGEASRVIPVVLTFSAIFDLFSFSFFDSHVLTIKQISAVFLLLPGALFFTVKNGKFLGKHIALKILTAFALSLYNLTWHFSSQPLLSEKYELVNFFMYNRIGSALILILALLWPALRKQIFRHQHIEHKTHTSKLFVLKQILGGGAFILSSFVLSVGSVPIFSALSGFRYLFLFVFGLVFSYSHKHILQEEVDKHTIRQKFVGLIFLTLGGAILFL